MFVHRARQDWNWCRVRWVWSTYMANYDVESHTHTWYRRMFCFLIFGTLCSYDPVWRGFFSLGKPREKRLASLARLTIHEIPGTRYRVRTPHERVWGTTHLAKLTFNYSTGGTQGWRFPFFSKNILRSIYAMTSLIIHVTRKSRVCCFHIEPFFLPNDISAPSVRADSS